MSFAEFFLLLVVWIPLLLLWIFTLVDLFRRKDLSGLAKGLWLLAIVLLPIFGMLIYFITRPPSPEEQEAARQYYRNAAGDVDVTDQLERLAELRDKGVLTDEEFTREKDKLLNR